MMWQSSTSPRYTPSTGTYVLCLRGEEKKEGELKSTGKRNEREVVKGPRNRVVGAHQHQLHDT